MAGYLFSHSLCVIFPGLSGVLSNGTNSGWPVAFVVSVPFRDLPLFKRTDETLPGLHTTNHMESSLHFFVAQPYLLPFIKGYFARTGVFSVI